MKGVKIKIFGRDVIAKIGSKVKAREWQKAAKKALMKSLEPTKAEVEQRVPTDSGDLSDSWFIKGKANSKYVGADLRNRMPYAVSVEWGHHNVPPDWSLRASVDETENEQRQIVADMADKFVADNL